MSPEAVLDAYRQFLNPGIARLIKFLGFDAVEWEAQGAVVRDSAGTEWLDFLGGFGVFTLGHRHPKVIAAVEEQLHRLPLSAKVLLNEPLARLAEKLADITPGDLQYSFLCNSGAEAVEGALKLARAATGRQEFVAAHNGFHGKTFGALSVTGREVFREPFRPLIAGVTHVPFGDSISLQEAVTEWTAAVILEPIQGEAGVIVPPDEYLTEARAICDAAGALLILDEVQTGLGRTGTMFACQREGVVPDILTTAKALGGGVMPIGAFTARPPHWAALIENPLLHSSTFGGSPLACAAACAAIDATIEEDLPARAAHLGDLALARLHETLAHHSDTLTAVRGRGLLIGVEFADADVAGLTIAQCAHQHLLAAYTLNNPRVIRLEPPLTLTESQLDDGLTRLDAAITAAEELLATTRA